MLLTVLFKLLQLECWWFNWIKVVFFITIWSFIIFHFIRNKKNLGPFNSSACKERQSINSALLEKESVDSALLEKVSKTAFNIEFIFEDGY